MILHGLRTLLLDQQAVTLLCPAQTINRVLYPGIFCDCAVQGFKPPYVVLTQIGGDPMLTLDSYSETLKAIECDIDSYSYSIPTARSLDRTIRQFLDDYSGVAGPDYTIKAVLFDEPVYSFDYPAEGADTKFHIVSTGYMIQYSTP